MKRIAGIGIICFLIFCVVTAHFCYQNRPAPAVSVIMSTYNRESRLPRAIKSVLNQTFSDLEFIIINDGSADKSADVIRSFQKQDSRIIFLNNSENKGLIYSLNRGLSIARGKYIARLDDDDEMISTRLEKQVAYMEKNPEAAVLATGYYAYKKGKDKDGVEIRRRVHIGCPRPAAQVRINMIFANGVAHPTTMLRRSFLTENNLSYNEKYKSAEDYKLWSDVIRHQGEIHCLSDPLTEYTRAGDNPHSFYRNMASSARQVRLDLLSDYFENPEEIIRESKCDILTKLLEVNKEKKLLDEDRLKADQSHACPTDKTESQKIKTTH